MFLSLLAAKRMSMSRNMATASHGSTGSLVFNKRKLSNASQISAGSFVFNKRNSRRHSVVISESVELIEEAEEEDIEHFPFLRVMF